MKTRLIGSYVGEGRPRHAGAPGATRKSNVCRGPFRPLGAEAKAEPRSSQG